MKKLIPIVILVLILALLVTPIVALASSIQNALYYGTIIVSNNSTLATNVAVNCTINTQGLIDGNYLNASANNCVIRSSAGADLPFQPSANASFPWAIWVPSIGNLSHLSDILYTANSTGGEIRYFPGDTGMGNPDNGSMELADNFTITQRGFWDTDYAISKNAVYKSQAFRTYISGTENITSVIGGSSCLSYIANDYCVKAAGVTAPAGAEMTIEAWFYLDALGSDEDIVACGDIAVGFSWWRLYKAATDKLIIIINNVGATDEACEWVSNDAITAGEWHFITATYDADATPETVVYLDGVEIGGADLGDGTNIFQPNTFMTTGTHRVGAGYADYWSGDIDEIRISDSVRSLADHITNYNGGEGIPLAEDGDTISLWHFNEGTGNPADETGNNDLVNAGATWVYTSPVIGGEAVSVTATGVSSGEYTVRTERAALIWAVGDALHFAPDANSYVDCGISYNATGQLWSSFWWRRDAAFAAGSTTSYAWGKRIDGNTQCLLYLNGVDGKLRLINTLATIPAFDISSAETSWLADTWYHIIFSTSNVTGQRLRVNNGVAVTSANLTTTMPDGGNFVIGSRHVAVGESPAVIRWVGEIANWVTGTDDLTVGEENLLYLNTFPGDETDFWYLDEGTGTTIYSYGSAPNNGTAGTANTWETSIRPSQFVISIDGVGRDSLTVCAASVPDNTNGWTFLQNNAVPYMEYHYVTVNNTQVQYIDWEFNDTTFTDNSTYGNDVTPSFRTTSSDIDVTAVLSSFLPISEAKAPSFALEDAPAFIDAGALTGNVTGVFTTVPPAGVFPLAGVITALATATSTPPQLPLLIIAVFIILACSLTVSATMRKYGSGSIIVKIIAITACMGVFIGFGNFGIDDWMLYVFLVIAIALAMASRQTTWT